MILSFLNRWENFFINFLSEICFNALGLGFLQGIKFDCCNTLGNSACMSWKVCLISLSEYYIAVWVMCYITKLVKGIRQMNIEGEVKNNEFNCLFGLENNNVFLLIYWNLEVVIR